LKVTRLLYDEIKDDYIDSLDINEETCSSRMNVILNICRDSKKLKELSNKYEKRILFQLIYIK
jgi:hypothetical protein